MPGLSEPADVAVTERTADSLLVSWGGSAGASTYRLVLEDGTGNRLESVGTPPLRVSGLRANRRYAATVRAESDADAPSGWTEPVLAVTALPKPKPPEFAPVSDLDGTFAVEWDVDATAFDRAETVGVELRWPEGRSGPHPLSHSLRQVLLGGSRTYEIRLTAPAPEPPGGMNESPWSGSSVFQARAAASAATPGAAAVKVARDMLNAFYLRRS